MSLLSRIGSGTGSSVATASGARAIHAWPERPTLWRRLLGAAVLIATMGLVSCAAPVATISTTVAS